MNCSRHTNAFAQGVVNDESHEQSSGNGLVVRSFQDRSPERRLSSLLTLLYHQQDLVSHGCCFPTRSAM